MQNQTKYYSLMSQFHINLISSISLLETFNVTFNFACIFICFSVNHTVLETERKNKQYYIIITLTKMEWRLLNHSVLINILYKPKYTIMASNNFLCKKISGYNCKYNLS